MFENDVNMYGTQALKLIHLSRNAFENDVNMYGTQAMEKVSSMDICLRMM